MDGAKPVGHERQTKHIVGSCSAEHEVCLILRAYLKTTYRGIIEVMETSEALKKCLGLRRLPHYSTLKYFADRSDTLAIVDAILADVVRQVVAQSCETEEEVAIDSTGVESTAASAYFNTRRGGKRKRYVKPSLCVTCGTLLPASVVLSWGPCNDKAVTRPLLEKTRAAENAVRRRRIRRGMGPSVLSRRLAGYQLDSTGRASQERYGKRQIQIENGKTKAQA
jgi:hypothetical protein